MTLLHVHTQLLESLDWDEEALNEALHRTLELSLDLSNEEFRVNAYELKKRLREEYSAEVCDNLILFYEYTERIENELKKDSEEDNG